MRRRLLIAGAVVAAPLVCAVLLLARGGLTSEKFQHDADTVRLRHVEQRELFKPAFFEARGAAVK